MYHIITKMDKTSPPPPQKKKNKKGKNPPPPPPKKKKQKNKLYIAESLAFDPKVLAFK